MQPLVWMAVEEYGEGRWMDGDTFLRKKVDQRKNVPVPRRVHLQCLQDRTPLDVKIPMQD